MTVVEPARVLYVEDDPALRGILAVLLDARPEVTIVAAVGTSQEALAIAESEPVDVALLDLALADGSLTGIELGIELRQRGLCSGIVIMSQHRVPGFLTRLDEQQRRGWSFLLKRADLKPAFLVDVLHSTARGLNVVDPEIIAEVSGEEPPALTLLNQRQREVMALAAQGLDAPTIASRLGLTAASVRQDLSRAYQILVPDPPAGADLRTLAVLRYTREARSFDGA